MMLKYLYGSQIERHSINARIVIAGGHEKDKYYSQKRKDTEFLILQNCRGKNNIFTPASSRLYNKQFANIPSSTTRYGENKIMKKIKPPGLNCIMLPNKKIVLQHYKDVFANRINLNIEGFIWGTVTWHVFHQLIPNKYSKTSDKLLPSEKLHDNILNTH